MAEFCLECMNKYLMEKNNQLTEKGVTVEIDLCEGCGQWKPCVVAIVNKEKIFRKKAKKMKRSNQNRKKVVVSQRRHECVYKRIADANEPFCETRRSKVVGGCFSAKKNGAKRTLLRRGAGDET